MIDYECKKLKWALKSWGRTYRLLAHVELHQRSDFCELGEKKLTYT
jgi:hypothetical protein